MIRKNRLNVLGSKITLVLGICALSLMPDLALSWGGSAHQAGTAKAIRILQEMYPHLSAGLTLKNFESTTPYDRFGPVLYDWKETPPSELLERLAWEAKATDHYLDLEFVDVEGIGEGRDDPHRDNLTADWPDADDFIGEIRVDAGYVGKGTQSLRFAREGADYTLNFEVRRGPQPYQLFLRLISFRCNKEQPWTQEPGDSDEVYILINGRKAWRRENVDRGDNFTINTDIPFYDRAWIQVYEEDQGAYPKAIDDKSHHTEDSHNLTAFCHFIDIRKGRGIYDDYDGYSYARGSGRLARDEVRTKYGISAPVDEGVNWWFNDEYVHIPTYYDRSYDPQKCSPAVERYTDGRNLTQRFPLAESVGGSGRGIPYTVFPPVDNMAAYWFNVFLNPPEGCKPNLASLGPVLHAVQDASVPHHAVSCLGNFHESYEDDLGRDITNWLNNDTFINEVKQLVRDWDRQDPNPPQPKTYYDRNYFLTRNPATNWPVDQLVTWMAVQAWNAMPTGGRYNQGIARDLTKKALALSVLILKKGIAAKVPPIHVDVTFHSYDVASGWVTFRIVNHPDSLTLECAQAHIVNRSTGQTYYGPAHSDSPFRDSPTSDALVSNCPAGSIKYLRYYLKDKPYKAQCRAILTLYSADNRRGDSVFITVDFNL